MNEPNIDPPENAGDDTPPKGTPPGKPATSADVVADKHAPIIKKLQTRVSSLEDALKAAQETMQGYEQRFSLLKNVPSRTNPAKALLEELEDFLAGKESPPPTKE